MIKVNHFTFNIFQENTYVVWDEKSKECAIIDPGCSTEEEENILNHFIESNALNVKYLINTHCHIDHILGNKFVKDKYNCEFYAPELDLPLLDMALEQAQMFGISIEPSPKPDKLISEDTTLKLEDANMQFLFTPGHTPGEFCILLREEKICISGDVLFLQGIGRTDLWGGDYEQLINSIKTKLFILNDDIEVFPGHGDKTTIGYEKENNPFL